MYGECETERRESFAERAAWASGSHTREDEIQLHGGQSSTSSSSVIGGSKCGLWILSRGVLDA